jgi:fatty-acyl-CoA synthase
MRTYDPAVFLDLFTDKVLCLTHILGVPTNFLMMAQEPGFDDADLSHVEVIGSGGAAVPAALIETFAKKGLLMRQMWGMTETGPIGLVIQADKVRDKVGSSGLPPMHCQLKICDDVGEQVEHGKVGELLIKGPNVTPGYWNNDEANALAYTADGWFKTGDAARQDEDGYYFIVDRWKDMYISGGENVYPAEVENVIFQLDGVLENAVVGIPHEKWGEVGRAYVVLKAGANLDEEAVTSHCKDRLASFKVPKEVCFIDELPHNATGKVLKHELRKD